MKEEIKEAVRLMMEDEKSRWMLSLVHLKEAQRRSVLKTYEQLSKTLDIDYPRTLLC
jgi:rubrerythrin